jgi:Ca2+-binding EF-hand superfamily protein
MATLKLLTLAAPAALLVPGLLPGVVAQEGPPAPAGGQGEPPPGQEEPGDQEPEDKPRPQVGPGSSLEESEYFQTIDYDGNGWISYDEARQALNIDRQEFWRYDLNRDARVVQEEFSVRYLEVVGRVGSFPTPQSTEVPTIAPPRDPDQLRNAFDRDLNGSIGPGEFQTLLTEYSLTDYDATEMFQSFDVNGDFRLAGGELLELARQLEAFRSTVTIGVSENYDSVEELFGEAIARPPGPGEIASPPQITGPLPIFSRLDLNRDGSLTSNDFDELSFPLTLPVRSVTVIASLDTDGDEALSADELRASME